MSIEEQMKTIYDLNEIALDYVGELSQNGTRDRAIGHRSSSDYILSRLREFSPDLRPETVPYEDTMWVQTAPTHLSVTTPVQKSFPRENVLTMRYSAAGDVATAAVAPTGKPTGCDASDFEGFPAGKIAVVARGDCTFCEKAYNAQEAGASAFFVRFLEGQAPFEVRLGCDYGMPTIPSVGVSHAVGQELLASQEVRVKVESEIKYNSTNIILDLPGGDKSRVFVIGAHLDSVPAGPGMNDDGSGSVLALEMVRAFGRRYGFSGDSPLLKNSFRVCWWGSEEWGLIGSSKYVAALSAEENQKILGYINFDMMASPNGYQGINQGELEPNNPIASGYIQHQLENAFESRGEPWAWAGLARSDFVGFMDNSIPFGGILAGANGIKTQEMADLFGGTAGIAYDPCYHRPCDTPENIDQDRQLLFSQVGAKVVQQFLEDEMLYVHLQRAKKPLIASGHDDEAEDLVG